MLSSDRLILHMLADLYEHLGLKNEMIDTKLVKKAIETGNAWVFWGLPHYTFKGCVDKDHGL
jgi:hypothetical protein